MLAEKPLHANRPRGPSTSNSAGCGGARASRSLSPRMQLQVTRWDTKASGPVTREKVLRELKRQGYSTTTYTFPPGCVFGDHSHGVQKQDAILSGRFLFRMEGEEVILGPGDMLVVPKGKTHYAEVIGDSPCEFVDASKH